MYGPVPGAGSRGAASAARARGARRPPGGRACAGTRDRAVEGGSMIVRAASSVSMPAERSQRCGVHAPTPAMLSSNGRSVDANHALDRRAEVRGPHRRAVGEPQPRTELEGVGEPAVIRLRDALGEVGDDRAAADPGNATEGDQAVIGERQHRPAVREGSAGSMQTHWKTPASGAISYRSVPPRWLARDAVVAAHTEPPPSASADGALPIAMRRLTLWRVRVDADDGAFSVGHPDRPEPGDEGDRGCRRRAPWRSPRRWPCRCA